MAALVIDASLAAAWCFPDEQTAYTNAILQVISKPIEAVAPRLWAYELRNGIIMGFRRKRITKSHADSFLALMKGLPIRLTDPLSYDSVFALANQHNLTMYDAAYLDLAMHQDLPLASLDNDLVRAANRSGVALFQP